MSIQLDNIWIASGIIIGFQVTAFAWRISREVNVSEKNDLTWLPPADIVNLVSMVINIIGVFILPMLGFISIEITKHLFAVAIIIYIGYPFCLAGHYEMFNNKTKRSYSYFPLQEKFAFSITFASAFIYILIVILQL